MPVEYEWVEVNPYIIFQDNLTFIYYTFLFPEIFTWLDRECKWHHHITFMGYNKLKVEFFEASGAVEFKLRFMPEN